MPDTDGTGPLPRKLLLATDLSCRCDRALDRAIALCRDWQAELVVVHALDMSHEGLFAHRQHDRPAWQAPEQRLAIVERQLRRELATAFIQPTIVVEEGEPAELVLRTAREQRCEMILVGTARNETFGRLLLGRTVDALIRSAAMPLLVVKNRTHGRYEHLLVATDFSADSRAALHFALKIQPRATTLFHAFEAPFSGWTGKTQHLAEAQHSALEACERFLDEAGLPEEIRRTIPVIAEHGTLADLLQEHAHRQQVDLVLLGLPERGFVMETLIGNRAKAAVDLVPCDILLIRDPPSAAGASSMT